MMGEVGEDVPTPNILDTSEAGPAAIRGGVLRIASYGAGALLGVLSSALLFRHLGVDSTGRYVTVISLIAIVAGISDLGLTAVGLRELSVRAGPERGRIASNLLGLRLSVTAVGIVAVIAFAELAGYPSVMVLGLALGGVGLVLQSAQGTLTVSLMSRLRLGWVSSLELLRQVLTVAGITALVVAGATLLPFLALSVPVGVVVLAGTLPLVRGDVPLLPAFDRAILGPLLRSTLTYSLAVAAVAIYLRVAVILVSLLGTAHELGYFSASTRVVETVVVVPQLTVSAAFPIFARAAGIDHQRFVYGVGRVFEVNLIVGIWVSLLLALGGSLVIRIIGGGQFGPAADILAIQGIGVAATFVGAVWGYALLGLGRHRTILAISLVALGAGSAMVAALLAVAGVRGAAVATVLAEAMVMVLGAIALIRLRPALTGALRRVPRIALAGAIGAAPALLPGLSDVEAVVISTVLYGASLLVLRAIPAEVWAALAPHLPISPRRVDGPPPPA